MAAADGRSSPVRLVDRPDTQVMFVTAADQPEGISWAWQRLEAIVTSLRDRRFFGVIDAAAGTYRACVQIRDGDDAARLGLQSGVIPGGRYLGARLRGEPPGVYEQIPATYAALEQAAECDPDRPGIEFYRRRDEIDVLMPVRDR